MVWTCYGLTILQWFGYAVFVFTIFFWFSYAPLCVSSDFLTKFLNYFCNFYDFVWFFCEFSYFATCSAFLTGICFFWFQVCIGPIMFNYFRGGWQNELKPGKLWEITRKPQEHTRTYNMFCNFQDFLVNFVWFSYEFLIIFVKLCARGESPGKPWRNRKQIIGKLSVRTWRKHIANH